MFELLDADELLEIFEKAGPRGRTEKERMQRELNIRLALLPAQRRKDAAALGELLEKHRAKDLLCCPEDCFCWDIVTFLEV